MEQNSAVVVQLTSKLSEDLNHLKMEIGHCGLLHGLVSMRMARTAHLQPLWWVEEIQESWARFHKDFDKLAEAAITVT